ncbi:hypothetical protein L2E82_31698 [Cichorium intybus]|uniref:Uncharacterized protein n=1 Tax=Cichorium intybus TaxID=13427 RepID=A0ACB9BFY5_CICIN|nr:hypothetical protein L2E82_31698 [Cichorium intybus]
MKGRRRRRRGSSVERRGGGGDEPVGVKEKRREGWGPFRQYPMINTNLLGSCHIVILFFEFSSRKNWILRR